jgi:hypothetical protein
MSRAAFPAARSQAAARADEDDDRSSRSEERAACRQAMPAAGRSGECEQRRRGSDQAHEWQLRLRHNCLRYREHVGAIAWRDAIGDELENPQPEQLDENGGEQNSDRDGAHDAGDPKGHAWSSHRGRPRMANRPAEQHRQRGINRKQVHAALARGESVEGAHDNDPGDSTVPSRNETLRRCFQSAATMAGMSSVHGINPSNMSPNKVEFE